MPDQPKKPTGFYIKELRDHKGNLVTYQAFIEGRLFTPYMTHLNVFQLHRLMTQQGYVEIEPSEDT